MTHRTLSTSSRKLLLAAILGLFLVSSRLQAEPVPGQNDRLVTQLVCGFLRQGHLSRPEIGDELSRRLFKNFLKDLDPTKLYFVQQDIDDFKRFETDLDDQLLAGQLTFAYKVYERFLQRVGERQKLVKELVSAPHDFTIQEAIDTDYEHVPYAQNDGELRERWRKRIKLDLLLNRLDKKPLAEAEAKQKVLDRYQTLLKRWKQLDNYDLLELYLSDLATAVDPHSSYMSPNTLDDFDIAMRLHLEGIGALLRSEKGQTIVVEIVPGGAAALDGRLKPNDKIIAVAQGDDKFVDVTDAKLRETVKLIRGARGTKVCLKVVPADKVEPVTIELTRQKIELKSQEARGEIIEQGKKADGKPYRIGVIDLPSFYADAVTERAGAAAGGGKSATEDVRKLLNDFKAKEVDGVILDLRFNGGGALTEALALTGLFIDQGPVVQVKGSSGKVQHRDDPEAGTVYSGPLMVLVSRFSASASEILAGAMQDYGRALIVGDSSTHGKGTVQAVVDLARQIDTPTPRKLGALKLTIQQFYRVNGDSTQNRGVASDVVLPSITEYLATPEKELDHAVAFDHVDAIAHEDLHLIAPELKTSLITRSAERIKKSADFTKLQKDIEQFKARKARKSISLNEAELREQANRDEAEKAEQKALGLEPTEPAVDKTTYKFQRTYINNEVLQIMEDFLQGGKGQGSP